MKKIMILMILVTTCITGCAPLQVDEDIERINDYGFAIANETAQYYFVEYDTKDKSVISAENDYETPYFAFQYNPSSNSYDVEILTNKNLYYSYTLDAETNEISNISFLTKSILTDEFDIEDDADLEEFLGIDVGSLEDYEKISYLLSTLLEKAIPNEYIYTAEELQQISLSYIQEVNSELYDSDQTVEDLGVSVDDNIVIQQDNKIIEIGKGSF